jgi:hypothetical protein
MSELFETITPTYDPEICFGIIRIQANMITSKEQE